MNVECLMNDLDFRSTMSRNKFEELAQPVLERAKAPLAKVTPASPPQLVSVTSACRAHQCVLYVCLRIQPLPDVSRKAHNSFYLLLSAGARKNEPGSKRLASVEVAGGGSRVPALMRVPTP